MKMRTSCRFPILHHGFFAALAFVALTTKILPGGVGSVCGFLLSGDRVKNDSSSNLSSRHYVPVYDNQQCRMHAVHSSSEFNGNDKQKQEYPQSPQPLQSREAFFGTLRLASLGAIVLSPIENAFAFDGGVGGLGKTKPETGVELFDETSAPIQNEKGIVSSEIKGKDGSPILVAFQTPWPLLPTSGALEARDIRSTESAFVQVTGLSAARSSDQKWKSKKEFEKVLMESVFAAQGKFGAYGQPYDIQAKKVARADGDESDAKPTLFSVGFTTLTPAMRESERRALVAATQVGADTLVILVVTTTSAQYASNEKTFKAIASSFEAIAAPESGLKNKRSSK